MGKRTTVSIRVQKLLQSFHFHLKHPDGHVNLQMPLWEVRALMISVLVQAWWTLILLKISVQFELINTRLVSTFVSA